MILVKLLSSDGIVFEEELKSCEQIRSIWSAYKKRNKVPNASDEPYPVNVTGNDLENVLKWARTHKRLPYVERTQPNVSAEHIRKTMSPEKRLFLNRYSISELQSIVRASFKLDCWRLYREINIQLDELTGSGVDLDR